MRRVVLLPAELALQRRELRVDGGFAGHPVGVAPKHLLLEPGVAGRAAGGGEIPPGGIDAGRVRPESLPGRAELAADVLNVALGETELLALHFETAREHRHPLAMPVGEPPGDLDRLGIGNLRREPAAPLGGVERPPLGCELALGRRDGFAHGRDRDSRLDERVAQSGRAHTRVPRGVGEQTIEPRFEILEHGPMYGPDLANVKQFCRHDMRGASVYTSGMPSLRPIVLVTAVTLAGCSAPEGGGAPCGIAALAGPVTLLDQFSVPMRTLAEPPADLPARVVVRFAAGPAMTGLVGRTDSAVVIGV